jgi:Domain of unknown function (DUF4411)
VGAHHPPDIFPGLWKHLDDLANNGSLLVSEEVLDELRAQDDGLLEWVKIEPVRSSCPRTGL